MLRYCNIIPSVRTCSQYLVTLRLCSSNSTSYKDKWPAKIREMEARNPVRLKRRPELFADNRHAKLHNRKVAHNGTDRYNDKFNKFSDDLENEFKDAPKQRPNDDSDIFGDYSSESKQRMVSLIGGATPIENDTPDDNFIRLNRTNGPKSVLTYEVKIERLCTRARMAEAQALFDKIVNEYRVKPTNFMYSNLIKGYASIGDMDTCFKLYNQLKKMGLKPRMHVYTNLFKVCGEGSADRQRALDTATNLLGILRHHGVTIAPITYKSAVKTFGMLGDIETAFQLADECPDNEKYDDYMLGSLLIACNSHKEAGFQLAVSAWRMMRKKKMIPLSTDHYNLLLRSLHTGSGDKESFKQLIQHQVSHEADRIESTHSHATSPEILEISPSYSHTPAGDSDMTLIGNAGVEAAPDLPTDEYLSNNTSCDSSDALPSPVLSVDMSVCTKQRVFNTVPDILHPNRKIPADIEIRKLNTPMHRLMLLGGVEGILARMTTHNCKPDRKTFFYLLRALPQGEKSEETLLSIMKEYGVAPDCPFYNYIMTRMLWRRNHGQMWSLISKMKEKDIQPDMHTYAILSSICLTQPKCTQLLNDMKIAGLQPGLLILKNLMLKASNTNFDHLTIILEEMSRCDVTPDEEFLRIVRSKFRKSKEKLVRQEQDTATIHKNPIDSEQMRQYHMTYQHLLTSVAS